MMVGLSRFELLTPRLSSVCSNQLSYRPNSGLVKELRIEDPGSLKTRQNVTSMNPVFYQMASFEASGRCTRSISRLFQTEIRNALERR